MRLLMHYFRYHVGESLIPSIRHYLRFIGAEEKMASHGFLRKVRLATKLTTIILRVEVSLLNSLGRP